MYVIYLISLGKNNVKIHCWKSALRVHFIFFKFFFTNLRVAISEFFKLLSRLGHEVPGWTSWWSVYTYLIMYILDMQELALCLRVLLLFIYTYGLQFQYCIIWILGLLDTKSRGESLMMPAYITWCVDYLYVFNHK